MADPTPQDTQEPQDGTNTDPQAPTDPAAEPQGGEENPDAAGSKAKVLDDLARERKDRQAAQTLAEENKTKLDAVLQALGLADKSEVDPDQLGRDLAAQRAENAVLRAGTGIADVDALLDSRALTQTLDAIDPSDRDAVKAHITEYVTANPRFAVTPQKAQGVRDAAAGAHDTHTGRSEEQAFADFLTGHSR